MGENFQEKNHLTKSNKLSFAFGGFGQCLIIGTVNSYLLFFFTDIAAIGYTASAMIMLFARIFDALDDTVMGVIIDKTRTKLGKLRPYLLVAPIPLGILTILLFVNPDLPLNAKIAYCAITYILWGLLYTVGDVSFWGLPSIMTPNPTERVKFITSSRLLHSIGGALPMILLPVMEFIFPGEKGDSAPYMAMGIFSGVIGMVLFSLTFYGSKERVPSDKKAPTVKECFVYLSKNKPLLTVVIANTLGFGRAIFTTAGMYVATYLIKDLPSFISPALANTIMLVGFAVAGFLAMLLTPLITRRFNYKKIALACCVIGLAGNILLLTLGLLVGYSIYLFLFMQLILGTAYGLTANINYAMIAESVEYLEWKEGKRVEGVSIAMQTLMNKIMTALQISLFPILLALVGFIEPSTENKNPVQTLSAINGLFILVTVLPIICWIVSGIVFLKYDFVGEKRAQIYKELAERRELAEAETATESAEETA